MRALRYIAHLVGKGKKKRNRKKKRGEKKKKGTKCKGCIEEWKKKKTSTTQVYWLPGHARDDKFIGVWHCKAKAGRRVHHCLLFSSFFFLFLMYPWPTVPWQSRFAEVPVNGTVARFWGRITPEHQGESQPTKRTKLLAAIRAGFPSERKNIF